MAEKQLKWERIGGGSKTTARRNEFLIWDEGYIYAALQRRHCRRYSIKISSLYSLKISHPSTAGKKPAHFFDLATTRRRYRRNIVAVSHEINVPCVTEGKLPPKFWNQRQHVVAIFSLQRRQQLISDDMSLLLPCHFFFQFFFKQPGFHNFFFNNFQLLFLYYLCLYNFIFSNIFKIDSVI